MVRVTPMNVDGVPCVGIEVALPNTTLLVISTDHGYVMCGALDIALLRDKLQHRGIIAARAVGVKTLEELLGGKVESCTQAAEGLGIQPGMSIRQALGCMHLASQTSRASIS